MVTELILHHSSEQMDSQTTFRTLHLVNWLIEAIRRVRNENKVDAKKPVMVSIRASGDACRTIESNREVIELLAMDTFPATALVKTASLNSVVTDSAPGMTSYVSGNKNNNTGANRATISSGKCACSQAAVADKPASEQTLGAIHSEITNRKTASVLRSYSSNA